jgi:hypothetical protein
MADLKVKDPSVQWTASAKTATAKIQNVGDRNAGPFQVYFTAEECPNASNFRPQRAVSVPGLAASSEISLSAELASLARAENSFLGNVYSVSVRADPKNEVEEASKLDNWKARAVQYDVSSLPIYTYNEALATILRGIEFDATAAGELEIKPGYYKISEHRVWTDTSQWAVALHVFKDYYESAAGTSSPPRRDEPFVFTIIEENTYNSSGRRFKGRDFYGHTLSFDVAFQSACFNVNSIQINCTAPKLTLQGYLSSALYTCGVTSEPAWSSPVGWAP